MIALRLNFGGNQVRTALRLEYQGRTAGRSQNIALAMRHHYQNPLSTQHALSNLIIALPNLSGHELPFRWMSRPSRDHDEWLYVLLCMYETWMSP